jgi:SAM-dependent methyltransferase
MVGVAIFARRRVRSRVLAFALLASSACLACERSTSDSPRALRAPDVPYEPSPHTVVNQMLKLAAVQPGEVFYDLGCGDGRIVIAAVRDFGARGVCVDIDPQRIRESRENAQQAGVADRIEFRTEDLFQTAIGDADVVTLFLWPSVNLRLRPKLLAELKPGTRVVSYVHDMGDWQPEIELTVRGARGERPVYLWRIR